VAYILINAVHIQNFNGRCYLPQREYITK